MSIRAYKIITQTLAKAPSFNHSNNGWILECCGTDWEGNGDNQVELDRERVLEKIAELKKLEDHKSFYLDTMNGRIEPQKDIEEMISFSMSISEALEILETILADFDKDEDYVTYECY